MITISKKIIIMLYSKLRILNTNELDENRVDFNQICSIRQQWLSILFEPITIMFWIVIIGYNRDTSINHKGAIQNLLRKVKSLIEIKCQKNEFLSFREQKKNENIEFSVAEHIWCRLSGFRIKKCELFHVCAFEYVYNYYINGLFIPSKKGNGYNGNK